MNWFHTRIYLITEWLWKGCLWRTRDLNEIIVKISFNLIQKQQKEVFG